MKLYQIRLTVCRLTPRQETDDRFVKTTVNQANNLPVVAGQSTAGKEQQYLTFLLIGEIFASAILNIQEIIEYLCRLVQQYLDLRQSVQPRFFHVDHYASHHDRFRTSAAQTHVILEEACIPPSH